MKMILAALVLLAPLSGARAADHNSCGNFYEFLVSHYHVKMYKQMFDAECTVFAVHDRANICTDLYRFIENQPQPLIDNLPSSEFSPLCGTYLQ